MCFYGTERVPVRGGRRFRFNQAINPFNFAKVKEHGLRYRYSLTNELPEIGFDFEGTLRVKKGTTTPVASAAAESEDDELLIRMKLPHFKYPEHTHFYKLGYFWLGNDDQCGACIEDETGKPIMTSGYIRDGCRSDLAFYPSRQERDNYFLKVRIAPHVWRHFNRTLRFTVEALVYGIGIITLHKEVQKYPKEKISWDIIEQVLHDKTITKEKKIDALLVTAKSISYELSLLHIASKENNISAVKLILGYCGKESVMVRDWNGETPLFYAARLGNDDVLKMMVEVGGKEAVMAKDATSSTAFHFAAEEGNSNALKIMLEVGGVEAVRKKRIKGRTPLHNAAENGHNDALIVLLEAGGDGSSLIQDGYRRIPLHMIVPNHDVDVVKTLLKAGGNAACLVRDGFLNTPLHTAAYRGNTPALKIMLEYVGKEALKMVNRDGHTPVMAAGLNWHCRDATILLLIAMKEEEVLTDSKDPNIIIERREAKKKLEEVIRMRVMRVHVLHEQKKLADEQKQTQAQLYESRRRLLTTIVVK